MAAWKEQSLKLILSTQDLFGQPGKKTHSLHPDETSNISNQKASVYLCQHCKNLAHSVTRVTHAWGGWWSSKSRPGHLALTFTAAVYTHRATVSLAESID